MSGLGIAAGIVGAVLSTTVGAALIVGALTLGAFYLAATAVNMILADFSNSLQEAAQSGFWHMILDWLPGGRQMADVLSTINDAVDRFLNYLGGTGITDAIMNLSGVSGMLNQIGMGLQALGIFPGGPPTQQQQINAAENSLPGGSYTGNAIRGAGQGGGNAINGATSIVIQVLDSNGLHANTLVATGNQSGVTR
jgi:hypothetical protein